MQTGQNTTSLHFNLCPTYYSGVECINLQLTQWTLWSGVCAVMWSIRSGAERCSDGGVVSSASRPSDRVRRDRYTLPPSSHHVSTSSRQVQWKPPPIGNRSRSGKTKGDSIFTVWLVFSVSLSRLSYSRHYSLFHKWCLLFCFILVSTQYK